MKAALSRLRVLYLALARRERALALVALLVLFGGGGELVLVEPALRERARLLQGIGNDQEAGTVIAQRLSTMQQPDPNGALRKQLATLQDQLASTDREFDTLQSGLVQPQHMGALLQSLLGEQRGLQLLGLRSLPVTAIGDAAPGAPKKPAASAAAAPANPAATATATATATANAVPGTTSDEPWLYRHAVEIRVQGSYVDMLSYLQTLENLPRRVHWGELEIDARNYPANVMTVTIYTVSLEKSWWVL